jgi:LPS export ABC transporter protein LptC
MRARELFLVLALAAIATALLWWTQHRAAPVQRAEEAFPSEIDYFMTDVRLTATNELGEPSYRLQAPRLEHVIADDSARAARPHVEVFGEQAPPWTLRAETGRMPADGVTIDLMGEVTLDRESAAGQPASRVRTREVTVNTLEKTARTVEPVNVRHGYWDIDAVGMALDLTTGRLELTRVRGIYEPPG